MNRPHFQAGASPSDVLQWADSNPAGVDREEFLANELLIATKLLDQLVTGRFDDAWPDHLLPCVGSSALAEHYARENRKLSGCYDGLTYWDRSRGVIVEVRSHMGRKLDIDMTTGRVVQDT
jgi:hypothetical protein